jgi:DNA-binding SARP family transcriptional activator/TolB-like protein
MIQLRVLGALDLRAEGGQVIQPLLRQPKRAALLAYLGSAAPLGTFHRRDTLVALFWPELDEPHARGALNTALRFLRQSAGEDVVLSRGSAEVALDPRGLDCDAAAFVSALAGHRLERALELYGGDLLEGFHLSGAPQFDEWLERERSRLRARAARAASDLADRYEGAGDLETAVMWARRAMSLAADDERAVRRLIGLLDSAGDRSSALRVYEELERRVASEFESEPAAETRALAATIRARTAPASSPRPPALPAVTAIVSSDDEAPDDNRPPSTIPRWHLRPWMRFLVGGAAAVGLAFMLLGLFQKRGASMNPATAGDRPAIVLAPFAFEGPPDSEYLVGVVTVLLSHALDGTSALRVIDQNVLQMQLGTNSGRASTLEEVRKAARSLGASAVIAGEVVDVGDRVSISARVYARGGSPVPLADAMPVAGPREELPELVKRLARDLLGHLPLGTDVRLAELGTIETTSFDALKDFADAQPLYRRGAYDSTQAALLRAIAHDSLFALAWYELAWTENLIGSGRWTPAIGTAMRLRDRLPRRDRLLVEGLHAFSSGDPILAEQRALEAMSRVRDHYETWLLLGRARFALSWQRGTSTDTARTAFERASQLAPDNAHVLHMRVFQELPRRRWAAADSLAHLAYIRSFRNVAASVRAATAYGREDPVARRAVLADLSDDPDHYIWNAASYIALYTDDLQGAREIAALLSQPSRSAPTHAGGNLADALLDLGQGRPSAANTSFARFATWAPEAALAYRAWFAAFPGFEVSDSVVRSIRASVQSWPPAPDTVELTGWWLDIPWELRPHLRTYLLGLLAARLGDSTEALAQAAVLEKARAPADSNAMLPELATEIRAIVAIEKEEFAKALELLESSTLRLRIPWHQQMPFARRPFTRWLRAEMLAKAGRVDEAIGWYEVFRFSIGAEFIFIGPADQRIGRLQEEAGRINEAREHYIRFLARWENAEPEQQHLVKETRRRLALLEARRR